MSLSMTVDRVNPTCAVAALHGGLSMGRSLKTAEAALQQLIDQGVRQLVVDLTDSTHSDSAAGRELLEAVGAGGVAGQNVVGFGGDEHVYDAVGDSTEADGSAFLCDE